MSYEGFPTNESTVEESLAEVPEIQPEHSTTSRMVGEDYIRVDLGHQD